uniref:USP domain-containing protein n=1 Tax=Knipowitschia caucasica TaxID=637954 RepID=A0AAV2M3N1_KNICA
MLQNVASSLGMTYKCPVQELEFSLDCRRICQTCGKGSRKREDFTNLSLDLCAETTTDKLLENYLKPTQLEYNCTCKGQVSTMSAMFSTLPNILVLHLKRYRYTRDYRLEKVHDGTSIDKDLVLSQKTLRLVSVWSGSSLTSEIMQSLDITSLKAEVRTMT